MPEASIVGLASSKPARLTLNRPLFKTLSPQTFFSKSYCFDKIKLCFATQSLVVIFVFSIASRLLGDGTVNYCHTFVDESMITGELVPVEKNIGDTAREDETYRSEDYENKPVFLIHQRVLKRTPY